MGKEQRLSAWRAESVGVTAKDNRLFVEAVLYRYRAGIPWDDLPERFGDFWVLHTRHTHWSRTGAWERIFQALSEDADTESAMSDSTVEVEGDHLEDTYRLLRRLEATLENLLG